MPANSPLKVLILALSTAFLAVPAPAAALTAVPAGRYVALGDSYSSGKGVEPYEGTDGDPDPCYRSFGAYPPQLAAELGLDDFEFWACSGAHVHQLSSRTVTEDEPPFDDPARVPAGWAYRSYLDRLGPDVTLVTITIGGHDAGFGDVMFECVQPFWLGTCDDLDARVQEDLAQLPDRLVPLYHAIRTRVAPDARVVVLGYPQLFRDDPGGVCIDGGFINADERRWLNGIAEQLNGVIAGSVEAVPGIEFVDVRNAFRTHEICGSSDAYLIGASWQHPSNSFHPNYKGQKALADAVLEHLATVPPPLEPPPAPPPSAVDSVGVFDPASGVWQLRYPDGRLDDFYYGIPGDVPLMGDWDCDGVDTVAMYRPSSGFVYLRQTNDFGTADRDFYYGVPGDLPVAGDWNGDGCDTLAIFRPSAGRIYVSDALGTRAADFSFAYGSAGHRPFSGDFDGDGRDSIGFLTNTGAIVYRNRLSEGSNDFWAYYGRLFHQVIAGDWDGDGMDTPGALRPDGTLDLWNTWTFGAADESTSFGRNQVPVAGRLGS